MEDRDRLSPLGHEQAATLGRAWASERRALTHVFVGPARRHHQTCDAVAAAYRDAGVPFPTPVELPGLDEYPAERLFQVLLPELARRDVRVQALVAQRPEGKDGESLLFRLLDPLGAGWARGELEHASVERWADFVARVRDALGRIAREAGSGAAVAAFTSAGPTAVATGLSLGTSGERVFTLSLSVRNVSCTDFLFSGERLSLQAFNDVSHLAGPARTLR
jgi:broad specificity phosphatase PhoE